MLTAMRNRAGSWVAKVFLLLLAASFGLWGVGDIFSGFNDPVVAEVGNNEIRGSAFLSEYSQLLSNFRRRAGGSLSEEEARLFGLPEQALNSMIDRLLLTSESKAQELVAGERDLARWLGEIDAFRGPDNTFDRAAFSIIARRRGMSESEYLEVLSGALLSQRILDSVGEAAQAPDRWIRSLHAVREERRDGRAAIFLASAVPEPDAPSEEDMRAQYAEEESKQTYRVPELRDVIVALLAPETLKEEIEITEEDIIEEFERRRSELSKPERRRVIQYLAAERAEADAVLALVREGSSLSEATAAAIDTDANSLDLGLVTREDLNLELAEAAFSLPLNEVDGPKETPFGWSFLEITEIQEASEPVLEEMREELRDNLALERAFDLLHDRSEIFYDELAGGATLEQAARESGAIVTEVRGVDSSGRDMDGKVHPDAPDSAVLALSFAALEGETTDLSDLPNGALASIRVDRIVPSRPKTFEEARKELTDDLLSEARREASRTQAEALAMEADNAEDFDALAETHGGTVRVSGSVSRSGDGADPAFPREAVVEAFRLNQGDTSQAISLGAGGYAVVRVDAVEAAGSPDQEKEDELRSTLETGLREDVVRSFINALRAAHPVQVVDAAFERVLSPDYGVSTSNPPR